MSQVEITTVTTVKTETITTTPSAVKIPTVQVEPIGIEVQDEKLLAILCNYWKNMRYCTVNMTGDELLVKTNNKEFKFVVTSKWEDKSIIINNMSAYDLMGYNALAEAGKQVIYINMNMNKDIEDIKTVCRIAGYTFIEAYDFIKKPFAFFATLFTASEESDDCEDEPEDPKLKSKK